MDCENIPSLDGLLSCFNSKPHRNYEISWKIPHLLKKYQFSSLKAPFKAYFTRLRVVNFLWNTFCTYPKKEQKGYIPPVYYPFKTGFTTGQGGGGYNIVRGYSTPVQCWPVDTQGLFGNFIQ